MARETHKFIIECEVTLDESEMDEWCRDQIKENGSLLAWFKKQALYELNDSESLTELAVYEDEKYDGGVESGGHSLMSFKIKED